jgi:hypothetical protein
VTTNNAGLATIDDVVTREGKLAEGRGGFGPYAIRYPALLPKRHECENLLVTFALSASRVASNGFSGIGRKA